jgi:hypothetical protein
MKITEYIFCGKPLALILLAASLVSIAPCQGYAQPLSANDPVVDLDVMKSGLKQLLANLRVNTPFEELERNLVPQAIKIVPSLSPDDGKHFQMGDFYSYYFMTEHPSRPNVNVGAISVKLYVSFRKKPDYSLDRVDCVTLGDLENYARDAGWHDISQSAGWIDHSLYASKDGMLFRATAGVGVGERSGPGVNDNARLLEGKGCAHEIEIWSRNL